MAEVVLFAGCIEDGALPEIGLKTVELLESQGHSVSLRPNQTCCGLPLWQEGLVDEATAVAAHNVAALAGDQPIVTTSGACAFMLFKVYPQLLPEAKPFAERVRQLCQVLDAPAWNLAPDEKVALQPTCVLEGNDAADRALSSLDDTHKVALKSRECCGFGGGLALHQPNIAEHTAAARLKDAEQAGCTTLVVSDAGCLLHLRAAAARGCPVRVQHLVDLLSPKR
jgi:L-lactate dehydrogenase complex protein LldE